MSSNIRKAAAFEIGVLRVVLLRSLIELSKVCLDCDFLVPSTGEIVGEATGTGGPGNFGGGGLCTSDGGKVGASGREDGFKFSRVLAIVAFASRADTEIAAGFQNRDSAQTSQADQVAGTNGVLVGNGLLAISVGVGNHLGQIGILLRQKVLVVRNVGLVLVGWSIKVRNEGTVFWLARALVTIK